MTRILLRPLPSSPSAPSRAALAAALTGGERIEAEIAAKRLEVAKRVRDALWMVAEAREKLAIAERRRTTASALAQSLRQQGQAGQSQLVDTKMADADVRDAEAALAGLRAELRQAEIAFRVLTGRNAPPAFKESEASMATPANHPRVVLRSVATQKAEADKSLVYAVDRTAIDTVVVAGKVLMRGGVQPERDEVVAREGYEGFSGLLHAQVSQGAAEGFRQRSLFDE